MNDYITYIEESCHTYETVMYETVMSRPRQTQRENWREKSSGKERKRERERARESTLRRESTTANQNLVQRNNYQLFNFVVLLEVH